jgi:prepilin-type N-terminal cleavage/methylation domain-containing protein
MPKRSGFTLIEVMVSVVIISTVILALLELISNSSHIFSILNKKSQSNQYISLLIANKDYGHEDKKATMYDLVREFDIESELRRELKSQKIKILYQELETIDMSESQEVESDEAAASSSGMVFEIGRTIIQMPESSASLLRIKLQ